MKRRLLVARALVNEPELVVLDEPTTGLDPQARLAVWRALERLRRQGVTLLLTTHYMEEAARLCDRLLIMDHGRIVTEGEPRRLVDQHVGREILELELTGVIADRVNLRWLYGVAFALWSLSQGLMGLAAGLGSLIAFRVLLGIGEVDLPAGRIEDRQSALPAARARTARRIVRCGHAHGARDGGRAGADDARPSRLAADVHGRRVQRARLARTVVPADADATCANRTRTPARAAGGFGRALVALVTNRNLVGVCLTFFCFDYYWYFLVNWLPDYLVTARGLTMMRAGIYAALPYLVFGMSEPIGGWLADRLVVRGWTQSRARKTVVTFAFMTGLLLIPAAWAQTPAAAVAFIIGGCLVGLATGNLLVALQSCAPSRRSASGPASTTSSEISPASFRRSSPAI